MNYSFQNPYPGFHTVYNDSHLSEMPSHGTPLLYHRQPASPDGSPTSSGSAYGQHNQMGQIYQSPQQYTGHAFGQGQGYSSGGGQNFEIPRQQYGSAMPQVIPTQGHSPPSDYMDENMDRYVNYDGDDSNLSSSSPEPADLRKPGDPPLPSVEDTEIYLRRSMSIPDHRLLNLWSLPSEPTKVPKISDLIKLAIWGSPNHRLTLRQIYDAIEDRYPTWKQAQDKPWQRSIRHNLSLKAMFVRVERPQNEPGKGYYWALNVSNGEGNKRDRKRKDKRDHDVNIKDEEDDDSNLYLGNMRESVPLSSTQYHRSDSNQNQGGYFPGNTMSGQTPYMPQSRQDSYTSSGSYNTGMGPGRNLPLAGGPLSQPHPSWGTQPSSVTPSGMLRGAPPQGMPSQGYPHHHNAPGSSHSQHRQHTGVSSSSRSSHHHSSRGPPMQGGMGQPMEGIAHIHTSRSSRRPHSDTSPDADDEEMARSAPRQRSGNRS